MATSTHIDSGKSSSGQNFRMLIVDDVDTLVRVFTRYLQRTFPDMKVNYALDGQTALQQLQQEEYDFILTDIRMPGMNGFELVAKIHDMYPDVWCAMMSGYADETERIQSLLDHGIKFFLAKPFDLQNFGKMFQDIVRQRHEFRSKGTKNLPSQKHRESTELKQPYNTSSANESHVMQKMPKETTQSTSNFTSTLELYPFIMGGLLHNALNTMMALRFHASRSSALEDDTTKTLKAIDSGTEHLEILLKLMQKISRTFYARTESGLPAKQLEQVVKIFADTNDNIRYHCHVDTAFDAFPLPIGVGEFIIGELLKNATSACAEKDHAQVSLAVAVEQNGQVVSFECKDSGNGFTEDMLVRIRNRQLGPNVKDSRKGYGLYLINELASRLNGTLMVSNLESGGSRVQILLALKSRPSL